MDKHPGIDPELVFLYCTAFGLNFQTHWHLAEFWGGEEEWENVTCAGIDHMGTPFIIREDDGRVKVVSTFADGHRHMEDTWTYVTEDALKAGKKLHAE